MHHVIDLSTSICIYRLRVFRIPKLYHIVKGQSFIKIYVLYNFLEGWNNKFQNIRVKFKYSNRMVIKHLKLHSMGHQNFHVNYPMTRDKFDKTTLFSSYFFHSSYILYH
ncbi:hypothetical protein RF11_01234 [Thelohanellus kitauei]|uniref:Uncharacterized protein n=1 Tax=Thelohanellus kitauei TaxID=669202 RepID=A0A0C2MRU1_THEKT|nr:hypothetical protein RF11_01234 [Thelohanellus kitauei]